MAPLRGNSEPQLRESVDDVRLSCTGGAHCASYGIPLDRPDCALPGRYTQMIAWKESGLSSRIPYQLQNLVKGSPQSHERLASVSPSRIRMCASVALDLSPSRTKAEQQSRQEVRLSRTKVLR